MLPALRSQSPRPELVGTLNNLIDIATMSGEYDRAVAMSRESPAACRQMRDKRCEAQARDDAGLALSSAGNYTDAARELDLAPQLNSEAGDAQTAVLILNILGIVDYYQAKYSESLRAYESALQHVEKAAAEPLTATWRQLTLLNLATLYQQLGNDQRAITIYNNILDAPIDLSARDVGHIYANLGVLYRHLGDPEQALASYRDAERFYAKEQDIDGELGVLLHPN
jgi:tetratricopeptide (TPR) repeat protein